MKKLRTTRRIARLIVCLVMAWVGLAVGANFTAGILTVYAMWLLASL